ncbi:hypothetical protein [Nesterenkonia populi]
MSAEKTPSADSGLGRLGHVGVLILLWTFLGARLIEELHRSIFGGETAIAISLPDEEPEIAVAEDTSLPLQDQVPVIVPTDELAGGTLAMVIGARGVLLVGLAVGTVLIWRALGRLSRGDAFTVGTISCLTKLYALGLASWFAYQAMVHFGANMILRDLDLSGESASGLWGSDDFMYGVLVLLALVIFTETLRQGKRNQGELEGLV